MNKVLSFFALMLITSVYGQTYSPMLVDGKMWVYEEHHFSDEEKGQGNTIVSEVSFQLKGDTLINGSLYHKMYYTDGEKKCSYFAAYREEGSTISTIYADAQEEMTLLEFDVEKILNTYLPDLVGIDSFKEEIDSVFVNGKTFRRHKYTSQEEGQYNEQILAVEGCGFANIGILGMYSSLIPGFVDYSVFVACYDADGALLFKNCDFNAPAIQLPTRWYYEYDNDIQKNLNKESSSSNKGAVSLWLSGTTKKNGRTYQRLQGVTGQHNSRSAMPLSNQDDMFYLLGIRYADGCIYADYEDYLQYRQHYIYSPDGEIKGGDIAYMPYRLTDDGMEIILYDFNMQVGDKFPTVEGYVDISVTNVEEATIGGKKRKLITLSNGAKIAEGIGCVYSKKGFFLDYLNPWEKSEENAVPVSYLLEYDLNGSTNIYYDSEDDVVDEFIVTSIEQFSKSPVRNSQIYDFLGRCLLKTSIHSATTGSGCSTDLKKGLYIKGGRKYIVR